MIPFPCLGPSLLANRVSHNFFRPPFKRERLGEGAPSLGRSLLATRAEKICLALQAFRGQKNFDWPSF